VGECDEPTALIALVVGEHHSNGAQDYGLGELELSGDS
jgi:hypothetical protein